MRILCTNDDGFLATGLRVLSSAARTLGEVDVVAPDREQSATSNSLTIHRPLRSRTASDGAHVVDGTPTDCVILALNALVDQRPDVCFSGVNHGANLGEDVLYSGTVAAAMEATVLGVPAIAVSYTGEDFESIVAWEAPLAALLGQITSHSGFPASTLLNVNLPDIPPGEVRGVRITSLGQRRYSDSLSTARDPAGREYFWIGGGSRTWKGRDDSDFRAISEGFISVTPLHLDLTNYRIIEEIQDWDLSL